METLLWLLFIVVTVYFLVTMSHLKQRISALEKRPATAQPLKKSESITPREPDSQPSPIAEEKLSRTVKVKRESILAKKIKVFFTTRNVIAMVGALLLLFGCGFLVKYASEHSMLSIQWRLALTACIGVVALVVGFLIKKRQETVSLVLQGLGLAIGYIIVFAAFQFYGLIGIAATFIALVLIAGAGIALSVMQNAKYLALFSFFGGFIAPLVLHTDQPNITALFSYYLVLNLGVFVIAWFKQWRELNYLGFIATFGVTGLWSYQTYTDSFFAITETFLIIFFIIYLIMAILFSYKQTHTSKKIIDTTLTFALPIIFFLYQAKILQYHPIHLAITAFSLAAIYGIITFALQKIKHENRPMTLAMAACGFIFLTAAIPLAMQNHWTGITWALEGAALFWFGNMQREKLTKFAGITLQIAATIAFIYYFPPQKNALYLLNGTFLGALILIVSAYFTAYIAKTQNEFRVPLFIIGTLWFVFIGLYESLTFFHHGQPHPGLSWLISYEKEWPFIYSAGLFFAASALIASAISRFVEFSLLQVFLFISTTVLILAELTYGASISFTPAAFKHFILTPYLIIFALSYSSLYLLKPRLNNFSANVLSASLWFAVLIQYALWVARFNHVLIPYHHTLQFAISGIALALYFLVFECGNVQRIFPFSFRPNLYFRYTPLALIFIAALWFLSSTFTVTGSIPKIPYLPLLNPTDLSTALVVFSIYYWHKPQRTWLNNVELWKRYALIGAVGVGFIWANAIVLRTLHNWAQLPLTGYAIMHSASAQISLSILWATIALGLTIGSSIKHKRTTWICGTSLIGITVLKVLLVDLSNQDTIARIISFMSVGVLLLLVGYFAPLPPKKK